jgi:hypothetical protein
LLTLAIHFERVKNVFSARAVGYCGFIDGVGATDPNEGVAVTAAFRSGELWKAQTLIRNEQPDKGAVLIGKGWWLSSSPDISNPPEHE